MKPDTSRNIDGSREAGTVVDLPGRCSIQDRRILLGVVQSGFVWPQINLLAVAVSWSTTGEGPRLCAEMDVVKSACSVASHVDVYHAVGHFEIFQRGAAALQPETAST